jgi:CRP-like cAMP-binding protein
MSPRSNPAAPQACQAERSAITNHLIGLLPQRDRQHLLAQCETVSLMLFAELHEADALARYAWFPQTAFVSVLVQTPDTPALEVGLVGREGLVGLHHVLGARASPLGALVQGEGLALRITRPALLRELERSLPLRRVLLRYAQVQLQQLATAAACHRFHAIAPRLARWLLMTQDRAGHSRFRITHDFMAHMLGVRRVGVTQAAQGLQGAGHIRYHRGEIEVLQRAGLEQAACSCYAADGAAYAALL